jgi:hypothetical protein
MALARPDTGRKDQQIDAEVTQVGCIAEAAADARPARLIIGRRIAATAPFGDCAQLNLGHGVSLIGRWT